MQEQLERIIFSKLRIQLSSGVEANVDGEGVLFVNNQYVRFQADNPSPGCYQCGFVPWRMISYINYDPYHKH